MMMVIVYFWCFLWCFYRCFDVKVQTAAAFVALMRDLGEDISRYLNLAWNGHRFMLLHSFLSKIQEANVVDCLSQHIWSMQAHLHIFKDLFIQECSRHFKTISCTYKYVNGVDSIKSQTWKVLVLNLRQSLVTFMDSFEAQMAPSGRLKVLWSKKLSRARFNRFFESRQNTSRIHMSRQFDKDWSLKIWVSKSFKVFDVCCLWFYVQSQQSSRAQAIGLTALPNEKKDGNDQSEGWDMRRIESPKDGFVFSSFPASRWFRYV